MLTTLKKLEIAAQRVAEEGATDANVQALDQLSAAFANLRSHERVITINDLGTETKKALETAVRDARVYGFNVLICDLDPVDGRTPTADDLRSDPELSAVWSYLVMRAEVSTAITERYYWPGGENLQIGWALGDHCFTSKERPSRYCLVVHPRGRDLPVE